VIIRLRWWKKQPPGEDVVTQSEWESFLRELSRLALAADEQEYSGSRIFSDKMHASGYLGQTGASEEQLAAAESRLGAKLPPSYRAFLRVSDGWPMMYTAVLPGRLWAVEELHWIRDYDPYEIKIWGESCSPEEDISPEEHLYSREAGAGSTIYREAYVENLLSISDHGDACDLLLSPEVVDEKGEWECWHIANWKPGASRERSFEAWMKDAHEFLRHSLEDDR